jgi:hypothetical protein
MAPLLVFLLPDFVALLDHFGHIDELCSLIPRTAPRQQVKILRKPIYSARARRANQKISYAKQIKCAGCLTKLHFSKIKAEICDA